MKKVSTRNKVIVLLSVLFISLVVFQCTKVGVLAKQLNRNVTPDSTVLGAFYDKNVITPHDLTSDVNDTIKVRGIQTILKEYCSSSNCHGGRVQPKLSSYTEITPYVVPGNPEASKLWEYITTNNFDKAMPPVNSNFEVPGQDKVAIYNWIKNGAKERPGLEDFRPAAVKIITNGCGSANCHNQATAVGAWARKGLFPGLGLTTADTTQFIFLNPTSNPPNSYSNYCQLQNKTILDQVWNAYKDSVKRFYADTLGNARFRPFKTFSSPWVQSSPSIRGPLGSYDDILMDIMYPKSLRSSSSVVYTSNGNSYYVRGNKLNATSSLVSRIDSTILLANPHTGVYANSHQGDMAYGDGGLSPSEIALIKAWYFADPNIPDVWKYGSINAGIFKYRKTGNIIKR